MKVEEKSMTNHENWRKIDDKSWKLKKNWCRGQCQRFFENVGPPDIIFDHYQVSQTVKSIEWPQMNRSDIRIVYEVGIHGEPYGISQSCQYTSNTHSFDIFSLKKKKKKFWSITKL